MLVIDEIAAERKRQRVGEGWTEKHDDSHNTGDMAAAAASYALFAGDQRKNPPSYWPWDWKWWKPKDRRRDLIRAGALIVAEIERLDRAASRKAA